MISNKTETSRELFWKALSSASIIPGNKESLPILESAAAEWRNAGRYFSAGYTMSMAASVAFEPERMQDYINEASQDFQKCVETTFSSPFERLAALFKWPGVIRSLVWFSADASIEQTIRQLSQYLAQQLLRDYVDSSHAENFLVRGVILTTDLEEKWEPSFPKFEVPYGLEGWGKNVVTINLPSAFHLFIRLGDYKNAHAVIERCPQAFSTPGLKGWMYAVQGFLSPDEAPEKFAKAANVFAEDSHPYTDEELMERGGYWTSMNIHLWARYFNSRSALASIIREPNLAKELIRKATSLLEGTESGWIDESVSLYRGLIRILDWSVRDERILSAEQAREMFSQEIRFLRCTENPDVVRFVSYLVEAFEGFQTNPAREIASGRLSKALDALARIPLIGAEIASSLLPTIGNSAWEISLGPVQTRVHRVLEGIKDEIQLQKIILRLAQSSVPAYAQLRPGPIEFGKDVVVLFELEGRRVLKMYQVKCGDITKPKWRDAQSELEEAFLVPLSNLHIPGEVDPREVVLVCNGHANPYVEPVMENWFLAQKQAYGRVYTFMHLDHLVKWVIEGRLINELDVVLRELGLG